MRVPEKGDRVRYVLPHRYRYAGQWRAAFVSVVSDPAAGRVNLQVLTDGLNDGSQSGLLWVTSVPYDPERALGTWHWD